MKNLRSSTTNKKDGTKGPSTRQQKLRFGFVGIINTAVDFIVLNVLVGLFGVPLVASNIVSTTAAMLTSFELNKKVVFAGGEGNARSQLLRFLVVTLSAIWIVQSTVIFVAYTILSSVTYLPEPVILNLAKLAGISAGLVWNYIGYSRFVFQSRQNTPARKLISGL
jgi:putative flippase GtrA